MGLVVGCKVRATGMSGKETGCKEAEPLHSNEELQAEVEDCWAMEDMDG